MKNLMLLFAAGFIIMTAGCKKNNDDNGTITAAAVKTNISSGQWQVSYFFKNGQTLTSDYAGSKFTFSSTGEVNVLPSLYTIQGTWSVTDNPVILNIAFTTPANFQPLTGAWTVVTNTSTSITLKSGTDQLLFEKI